MPWRFIDTPNLGMLNDHSKSTDMKDSIHMPRVYGVVGGCFFIVDIQFHSRHHAIFPVGAGTISTERIQVLIRVLSSLINTITIDSSQIDFNNAYCT
jgi:hypothetical protein